MRKNILLLIVAFAAMTATAVASIPATLNLQGLLLDGGSPVTGTVSIDFDMYTSATGGSPVHSETRTVTVTDGYYNIRIGVPPDAIANVLTIARDRLWYELTVNGTPQGRVEFDAVPFAFGSKFAEVAVVATPIGPAGGLLTGTYPDPGINEEALKSEIEKAINSMQIRATPTGSVGGTDITGHYPDGLLIVDRAVKGKHIDFNVIRNEHLDTFGIGLNRIVKPTNVNRDGQILVWNNGALRYEEFTGNSYENLTHHYLPMYDANSALLVNSPINWENNNLRVAENVTIDGNLTVNGGSARIMGDLHVMGTVVKHDEIHVDGAAEFADDLLVRGNLTVLKTTKLGDDVTIANGSDFTFGSYPNISNAGNFDVSAKNAYIYANDRLELGSFYELGLNAPHISISATDRTSFDGQVAFSGEVIINEDLTVGTIIKPATVTIHGDLVVDGNLIAEGIGFDFDDLEVGNLTITGNTIITGNDDFVFGSSHPVTAEPLNTGVFEVFTSEFVVTASDYIGLRSSDLMNFSAEGGTIQFGADRLEFEGRAYYQGVTAQNSFMPTNPDNSTFASKGYVDIARSNNGVTTISGTTNNIDVTINANLLNSIYTITSTATTITLDPAGGRTVANGRIIYIHNSTANTITVGGVSITGNNSVYQLVFLGGAWRRVQ